MDFWDFNNCHVPASDIWKSNDVVLDHVFKFLSLPDLKSVRLVWKKWAIVGSRILAKKSIIRLTEAVPHNHEGQVEPFKLPHWRNDLEGDRGILEQSDSIWEWEKELEPRNYFSIDSHSQYTKLAAFSSEFKPRHVAVYKIEDTEKLPIPYCTTIETLQVVFYKPTKGYTLLLGLHQHFPNVKSLELRYIEPEKASSNSMFFSCGNSRPTVTKIRNCLQELSFSVPADLVNRDWSFMENFTDLKTLKIRWPGAFYADLVSTVWLHSNPKGMNHAYLDSNVFGNWITSTKRHFNLDRLHEITLRFNFTTTNIAAIQRFLNAANAGRILLEVHGDIQRIAELIVGFTHKTVGALVLLHIAGPDFLEHSALEIMKSLNNKGFFEKAAWALVFREYSLSNGWIHLEKEKQKFVLQLQGAPYLHELFNDIAKQFPFVLGNSNYAYCHKTDEHGLGSNRSEAFTKEAFLAREFLNEFHWDEVFPGIRRKPFRLLCDFDEFQTDAELSLFSKHSKETNVCTWSFLHVPEAILTRAALSLNTLLKRVGFESFELIDLPCMHEALGDGY